MPSIHLYPVKGQACQHCSGDSLYMCYSNEPDRWQVECRDCGARGPVSKFSDDEALEHWNERQGVIPEVNFPANIIMHLDLVEQNLTKIDVAMIRREAYKEIEFLKRIRAIKCPSSVDIQAINPD